MPDGRFDPAALALDFERIASGVEPRLYRLVLSTLLRLAP